MKKEISKKKNMINAEKLKEMIEDLLGNVTALIDQSVNLLKTIYGIKTGKQIEENPDKQNRIEVPDYSLLYTGLMLDTVV